MCNTNLATTRWQHESHAHSSFALLARLEHVQPVAMEDAVLGQHLSPGGATSPGPIIYALPAGGGHVQNVGVC